MNLNRIITYKVDFDESDRFVKYVIEKYDLQQDSISKLSIPFFNKEDLSTFDWNIGMISGNSGSGKTSIINNIFGGVKPIEYDNNKAIVSQFPYLSEEEVCDLFESVGLSSIPVWLHKPNQLSVGELARLDLCAALAEGRRNGGVVVIDEFTSTVNRLCAKSLAFALQRYVRKNNLKLIIATCHFDVLLWLQPDWVFNLNKEKNGMVEIEKMKYKFQASDSDPYPKVDEKEVLTLPQTI